MNSILRNNVNVSGQGEQAMMFTVEKGPDLFTTFTLIAPSSCCINECDYIGRFTHAQINGSFESLDANHMGWSLSIAPFFMSNVDRLELGEKLVNSFYSIAPSIAKQVTRTTFLTDNRNILPLIDIPSLIIQCLHDTTTPETIGYSMHAQLLQSILITMQATDYWANLSMPKETVRTMKPYLV